MSNVEPRVELGGRNQGMNLDNLVKDIHTGNNVHGDITIFLCQLRKDKRKTGGVFRWAISPGTEHE